MKKLNITKKQYDESKYFNTKYGALKFVSESGKLYKTDKGVVIALESTEDDEEDEEPKGGDDEVTTPGEGEEEITVKKEDLATALQDVIDTVKDIAADNDVELPGEEKEDGEEGEEGEEGDEGDDDEGIPGDDDLEFGFVEDGDKGDICPTCGCKKGSCKKEDECTTTECGGKKPAFESRIRRIRRARMVREAAKRRARAKQVLESIRKRRAAKVLESIRRRRIAKQVLESARRRRLAKKMMESRKVSPLARRIRMRKMMESARRRARMRRLGK